MQTSILFCSKFSSYFIVECIKSLLVYNLNSKDTFVIMLIINSMYHILIIFVLIHDAYCNGNGSGNSNSNGIYANANKPMHDISIESEPLAILAMSTNDKKPNRWYKWLSTRYYEDSNLYQLKENIDSKWHDGSICPIRFYGIGNTKNVKSFWRGGVGLLENTVGHVRKLRIKDKIPCYYQTTKDNWALDSKYYLKFSIYCPVMIENLVNVGSGSNGNSIEQNGKQCEELNSMDNIYKVSLFPSAVWTNKTFDRINFDANSNPNPNYNPNPNIQIHTDSYHYRIYNQDKVSLLSNTAISAMFQPSDNNHGDLPPTSKPNNVASTVLGTVQTFVSPTSGPNLYLFTKYHSMLGFTVLIYDRFASHYEYIKELIEPYGVIYHGHTPLELLNPSKYDDTYRNAQVCIKISMTLYKILYLYIYVLIYLCVCVYLCLYIYRYCRDLISSISIRKIGILMAAMTLRRDLPWYVYVSVSVWMYIPYIHVYTIKPHICIHLYPHLYLSQFILHLPLSLPPTPCLTMCLGE